jgi:hypothetical protein
MLTSLGVLGCKFQAGLRFFVHRNNEFAGRENTMQIGFHVCQFHNLVLVLVKLY